MSKRSFSKEELAPRACASITALAMPKTKTPMRDAIRAAAVKTFYERGYAAATIRQIAAELGIQGGSLYNHYASKQEILLDVMVQTNDELLAGLDAAIADAPDAIAALRAAIVFHVAFHRDRHQEAFLTDNELRNLEPENYPTVAKQRKAYERRIQRILEQGQESGEFEVADTRVVSYAIITACSAVPSWFKPKGRLTIDEVGETYASLILGGVLRRS